MTCVTGTYEKEWETKNEYTTIGKLFIKEDGSMSFKINTVPVGDHWNGRGAIYSQEDKDKKKKWSKEWEPLPDAPSDDLPF